MNFSHLRSLTDEELVKVVELNSDSNDLNKELSKRLNTKIMEHETCSIKDICVLQKAASTTQGKTTCDWLLNEVEQILKTLKLLQDNGETDLEYYDFNKISNIFKTLEDSLNFINSSGENFRITNNYDDDPDLVCDGLTPIFLNYDSLKDETPFEQYFNENLNPDKSTYGFLEQLDHLLKIYKKRPLIIYSTGDAQELSYCDTIKNYLESQ